MSVKPRISPPPSYLAELASRHMYVKDGFPTVYFTSVKSRTLPLALATTCTSLTLRNLTSVCCHRRPVSGDLDSSVCERPCSQYNYQTCTLASL